MNFIITDSSVIYTTSYTGIDLIRFRDWPTIIVPYNPAKTDVLILVWEIIIYVLVYHVALDCITENQMTITIIPFPAIFINRWKEK